MLTPEDELDLLDTDIRAAERRLADLEHAPHQGRWTRTPEEWLDATANQRVRIQVLREQRAALAAAIEDEERAA